MVVVTHKLTLTLCTLGIMCLLPLLLQQGVPYVRERSILTVSMPNTWNFAWDHAVFVTVSGWQMTKSIGCLERTRVNWPMAPWDHVFGDWVTNACTCAWGCFLFVLGGRWQTQQYPGLHPQGCTCRGTLFVCALCLLLMHVRAE
jgi:hypothetical protein